MDDRSRLRSFIQTDSPKVAAVLATKRTHQSYTETVKLKSGVVVTLTVGGCAHFAYSSLFRGLEVEQSVAGEVLVRLARQQLEAVPVRANAEDSVGFLRRALSRSRTEVGEGAFRLECGDATCEVSVPEPGTIEISYDFAI